MSFLARKAGPISTSWQCHHIHEWRSVAKFFPLAFFQIVGAPALSSLAGRRCRWVPDGFSSLPRLNRSPSEAVCLSAPRMAPKCSDSCPQGRAQPISLWRRCEVSQVHRGKNGFFVARQDLKGSLRAHLKRRRAF